MPDDSLKWQQTLWLMVLVQFIISVATSGISPVLPLFLPGIGVTDLHAINFWSGVLIAVNPLVAAFVSPLWGSLADQHGRKLMVLRSSLALCGFNLLMGFSHQLWELLLLRTLMGAFSGFSASAIALVATQVPEKRLGYALGWLSTGQLIGTLTGPLITGVISDMTGDYRLTFFSTSIFAGIGVIVAYYGVTETRERTPERKDKPTILQSMSSVMRAPGVLPIFLVLLMARFGVRSVQPVITTYVQELVTTPSAIATLAGFAFSVTGLADVIASPFLGKRSDSLGYRRVLIICLIGTVIFTLPQAYAGNYWIFLLLRFCVGMFMGGILPTANALAGRMVESKHRGLAYGVTASASFLGSSLGPFVGGIVAAFLDIRAVFILTGILFALTLLWVWWTVPKDKVLDSSSSS